MQLPTRVEVRQLLFADDSYRSLCHYWHWKEVEGKQEEDDFRGSKAQALATVLNLEFGSGPPSAAYTYSVSFRDDIQAAFGFEFQPKRVSAKYRPSS